MPASHLTLSPRPARRIRTLHLIIMALCGALVLPGCGSLGWIGLGRDKDPSPPAELSKRPPQEVHVRTLWRTRIGKGHAGRALNLRPAIAGESVFAADANGRIAALNRTDGRIRWERKTELPFSGGPDIEADHLVIGSADGEVLLLSAHDGSERWRTQLDSEILSVPRVIGDLVIVHTIDDTVYGLEISDGSERWRYGYQAPILTLRGSSSPAPGPEGIIVGVSNGRLVYLEPQQGAPIWEVIVSAPSGRSELERIADIDTDPVIVGDQVYVASYNGDLAAVAIPSGTVLWRRELSAHAGLAADDNGLFITDSDDNLWAASPSDGAGRWKQDALLHRRLTAPALIGDALVVGDLDGYVHWVARRDGRLLGRARVTKAAAASTPVVIGDTVFLQFENGTLAAVRGTRRAGAGPEPATDRPRPLPLDTQG